MENSIPVEEQSHKRICSKCDIEMRVDKSNSDDKKPYFATCIRCGSWFDIYIL